DQVLGAANAYDFIKRAPAHRVEAVRRAVDLVAHLLGVVLEIDPRDVGAWRHYGMHVALGQTQHAADHVAFFIGEGQRVGLFRVGDHRFRFGAATLAQHTQHGFGSALTHGPVRTRQQQIAAGQLVQHFDDHGETDSRIQVALGHLEAKAFRNERKADHQKEAQAQDYHRGMRVHEAGEGLGGQQHDGHGDDDRRHHDFQVIDHPDSGNDGIEREHGIEHDDLGDDDAEARVSG